MRRHLNRMKSAIVVIIALTAALATSTAWAYRGHGYGHGYGHHHHGGARVGLFIGGPVLGFPYYGYPAYGYGYGYGPYGYYGPATTVITTPATAPVYIEQSSAANNTGANPSGPASDGYWYYCSNPDGYYPYVKQCVNGWQKVPPQPGNR